MYITVLITYITFQNLKMEQFRYEGDVIQLDENGDEIDDDYRRHFPDIIREIITLRDLYDDYVGLQQRVFRMGDGVLTSQLLRECITMRNKVARQLRRDYYPCSVYFHRETETDEGTRRHDYLITVRNRYLDRLLRFLHRDPYRF